MQRNEANCSKKLRQDSAGIRTQALQTPAHVLLTAPCQAAGVTSLSRAGNLRGRKASSAEPPNPLHHIKNHSRPIRQRQIATQVPACPRPLAPGPALTLHRATYPVVVNHQRRRRAPLRPYRYHSPQRLHSSCPCRSCGFSGGPRPQVTPAGEAPHCPGGHPPSPGPRTAPETQNTRKGLY